ncbi:MAG: hypothetical protein M3P51_02995 [Chloroflexota bacterium]|nr:hypothetical protein [Chloroflexota bacterium]
MSESLIRYLVTTYSGASPVRCTLADRRQARALRRTLEDALLKLEWVLDGNYPPSVRVLVQCSVLDVAGGHVHGRAHRTPQGTLIIRLATEVTGKPVSPDAMVSLLADFVFQEAVCDSPSGSVESMQDASQVAAESPSAWQAEPQNRNRRAQPMLLQHTDPLAGSYAHEADPWPEGGE